ncbi:MAG TPA: prepilin-type N-terminal cleavage/methylation domain-containing protein [Candidatus Omnitrophota bacterium]|nr:prepilin-type N-terminal cleavage/methylation domain-containing protein [Candidatus Omnitrophota bacterium]
MKIRNNSEGFTFIELLITLAVIAICFIPLMNMFSVSLEQVTVSEDIISARFLLQEGMERLKNLGFTEAQIKAAGDVWFPELEKEPYLLNGKRWRMLRQVIKNTDPLEVHIYVYEARSHGGGFVLNDKPVAEAATLIEDLDWQSIQ